MAGAPVVGVSVILFLLIFSPIQGAVKYENDVHECKLTQSGTDFFGSTSFSISGSKCMHWETYAVENNLSSVIRDTDFPDASRKQARNFCRNPTRDADGPWCLNLASEKKSCNIPFCDFRECRYSGPGQEYQGNTHLPWSSKPCLPWAGELARNLSLEGKMSCANPSGTSAGPWCHVMTDTGEEKQLCDVPICDFPACGRVGMQREYSMFTKIDRKNNKMTLSVRLLDPALEDPSKFKGPSILFSSQSSPDGASGFELQIGFVNQRGGIRLSRWPPNPHHLEYADVVEWKPNLPPYKPSASGHHWAHIWVSWNDSDIRAGQVGLENIHRVSLEIKQEQFNFYSLSGPRAMWALSECCEIHTTSDLKFSELWPLRKTEIGYDLQFYVRSFHSVVLRLYQSADFETQVLQISLQKKNKNFIQLIINDTQGEILSSSFQPDLFPDPWQWSNFALSVFGDTIEVTWTRSAVNTMTLLKAKHDWIPSLRWVGIGSGNTLTQWALQCKPSGNDSEAVLPECSSNSRGLGYVGHQRAASSGHACIPWSHEAVPDNFKNDSLFINGSVLNASNYCRNPDKDILGPWCYTSAENHPRETCKIRPCLFQNCRMAGTGNDYMGTLSRTISGRECQSWLDTYPHQIPKEVLNKTRFPERDIKLASNYCRNPNFNITGSWCYTTDPDVPFDVCSVRNCEKPDECTIVTVQSPPSSNVYILPKWRMHGMKFWLKEWDPERPDGIKFSIRPLHGSDHYLLLIGANKNEAIQLYHVRNSEPDLQKEKLMSHIIPVGKWGGFWLQMDTGLINLGYEDVEEPIFTWKDKSKNPITPMLLGFGSIYNNLIGIHFPCDECLTQHFEGTDIYATPELQENVYPIHLWRPSGPREFARHHYKQTTLQSHVRGNGYLMIQLMHFPGHDDFAHVMISRYVMFKPEKVKKIPIFETLADAGITNEWRVFTIKFNETDFEISYLNGSSMAKVHYRFPESEPFRNMYYYFLVKSKGAVDWSVNCLPADVEGPPRDGGWSEWSPWQCNAPCGGGQGLRKRTCNNPVPNVFGKYCVGPDVIRGRCNEDPCGKPSKEVMKEVRAFLNSNHHSYFRHKGDNFSFSSCMPPVLPKLMSEVKNVKLGWNRNGVDLHNKGNPTVLSLIKTSSDDSGVYSLVAQAPSLSLVLCTLTLSVLTPVTVKINASLELNTNAQVLSSIYPDLKIKWVLNNYTWKSYGVAPFSELKTLHIPRADVTHTGVWRCVVTQIELGFTWTTATYQVKVVEPPTMLRQILSSRVLTFIEELVGEAFVLPVAMVSILSVGNALCAAAAVVARWRKKKSH